MIRWIIPGLWLLMACKQAASPSPVVYNAIPYPAHLPQTLINYITTNFPQWQLVSKTDYSTTWWSFYDSSYNPCWARTDINDDQLADYAVWLKKNHQLQLVICTGRASHSFAHYITEDMHMPFDNNKYNLETGVAVAPPGQIDVATPRLQTLLLKSNGFALLELEHRTRIYYWHNDSLQTFYMK